MRYGIVIGVLNKADGPAIFTTPAEYLVMPLQNAIHGPVIETLDCLLDTNAEAGPSSPRREAKMEEPVIIGDLDLPIRHCLVARRGVTIEEIKWVRSHEQVSGLCEWRCRVLMFRL